MKRVNFIYPVLFLFPLLSFSQNGLTSYSLPTGYTSNQLQYRNDLKTDAANNVWVAFRNIGLGKFDGANWTVFNNSNSSFPDTTVYAIGFDMLNNLWAGSNKGLTKYDGTTWTTFNTLNSGLPDDTVKAVTTLGNNIWCGTNKGVAVYDGTNWTIYNTLNSGIINDTINAFAFGTNGEAWIGTNNGLSKFYQGTWTNFDTINSGVTYNYINYLLIDVNNKLWIGSGKFPQNNLDVLAGNTINNFYTDIYNGTISVGINRQSLAKNQQGNIYGMGFYLLELSSGAYNIYIGLAGAGGFGNALAFDFNNVLWSISRRAFGTDFLRSFDFTQYNGYGAGLTNQNFKYLDVNNVKAAMMNFGMMHWDLANSKYEVPKSSGKTSVYASALWIGGLDQNNQLHVAAQTYRQTGNDFWPGPIDTVSGIADSNSVQPYDKIWKVNRFDVEDFKYNFLNGNVTNGTYSVLPDMLTWPAQGTGNITRDLAPYVDYNGDGNYNSYDGDYPLIKGDQMLYWIFNDNLTTHSETGGLPLGFEIHASAYSYTCPNIADSNSVLNTTTLYNYKIINRSSNNYDSLFMGLWCDVDLGDAVDDYVGCDSIHNASFGYNGDNDDGTAAGYGLNPPMQNIQILKGPLAKANDNIDNDHDGLIDELGERCMMDGFLSLVSDANPCGNPIGAIEFYYFTSNRWRDGSHLMYNTYCGNITTPTDFMYSGTPYDSSGWSENTLLSHLPGDRRMLVNTGPFSLAAGEETSIDFAYVWTRDSTAPNGLTTSIARNIADLQRVKNWFDTDSFPSCLLLNVGTNEIQKENNFFSVHPNPALDKLYIEFSSAKLSESSYDVVDMLGRTFMTGNLKSNFINIVRLPEGLYVLRINTGEKAFRQKFVKK
jgi:hypothetical protein